MPATMAGRGRRNSEGSNTKICDPQKKVKFGEKYSPLGARNAATQPPMTMQAAVTSFSNLLTGVVILLEGLAKIGLYYIAFAMHDSDKLTRPV